MIKQVLKNTLQIFLTLVVILASNRFDNSAVKKLIDTDSIIFQTNFYLFVITEVYLSFTLNFLEFSLR